MSWNAVSLGILCDVKTGKKDVNEGNINGLYPFFTCAAKHTYSDVFSFDCEAILIAGNGAVGQTSYYKGKFEAYQRTYVLCNFVNIIPQYLLYVLNGSLMNELSSKVLGNTIPYIKKGMLTDFQVPLPPLATQQKIVEKLDAIFAEIDKATAAAEANAKNAELLFQSYLTQVFEIGGKEWQTNQLGKITKFIDYRGKTPTKTDSGIRLITAKNVKFGYLNKAPYEYIAEEDYVGWMTRGIPEKGDVLFTTEAPLANVAQLDTDEKVVFAQRLIILQSKKDVLDSEFLKFSLLSRKVQNEITSKGTGATVKGIKASLLKLIPIDFPSLNEQRKICSKLSILESESKKVKLLYLSKASNLSIYKKSILKKAFAGELIKE